jgi:hypothetical protein
MNEGLLVFLGGLIAFISFNLSPLTWFFRRSSYGSLLLDLGRIHDSEYWLKNWLKLALLVSLIVFLIIIASEVIERGYSTITSRDIERTPAYLTPVFYFIATYFSHTQLREKGICYEFQLIEWKQIKSYQWGRNLLIIEFEKKGWGLDLLNLPIPRKYRDAVNHILAEHIPMNCLETEALSWGDWEEHNTSQNDDW